MDLNVSGVFAGDIPKSRKFGLSERTYLLPKSILFARVDVGDFVSDCFATDHLTENGHRVPMFRRK